jgi:hypothetical protein
MDGGEAPCAKVGLNLVIHVIGCNILPFVFYIYVRAAHLLQARLLC